MILQIPPINIDNLKSTDEVKEYLLDLNKRIRFLSTNLDEDNFSEKGYERIFGVGDKTAKMTATVDELNIEFTDQSTRAIAQLNQRLDEIDLLVKYNGITNQINLSPEMINISGNHLIVDSDNFKLDANGNVTLSGTINARTGDIGNFSIGTNLLSGGNQSTINAARISGTGIVSNTAMTMTTDADVTGTDVHMEDCYVHTNSSTYFGWFTTNDDINITGNLTCNTMYISVDTYVSGMVHAYSIYSGQEGIAWSDRAFKKDIEDISPKEALDYLMKLRPVTYHFRDDDDGIHYGLVAQDVLSTGDPYNIVEEMEDGFYSIKYSALDAVIAAALQEQVREMEELNVSL